MNMVVSSSGFKHHGLLICHSLLCLSIPSVWILSAWKVVFLSACLLLHFSTNPDSLFFQDKWLSVIKLILGYFCWAKSTCALLNQFSYYIVSVRFTFWRSNTATTNILCYTHTGICYIANTHNDFVAKLSRIKDLDRITGSIHLMFTNITLDVCCDIRGAKSRCKSRQMIG